MMLLTFPRSLFLGCTLVNLAAIADAQPDFPLLFGRSTKGTWKDGTVDYEIVYYGNVHFASGPSNQLDCVLSKLTEDIFVSLDNTALDSAIEGVTKAQVDKVNQDYVSANPEEQMGPLAGGIGISISGGQGPYLPPPSTGNSVDNSTDNLNGASTAQSRQHGATHSGPTVASMFSQRSDLDQGERGGLQYEMDINLGLYIEGAYVNRFEDILKIVADLDDTTAPKELEAFVLEQAKTLVRAELITETMDDDFFLASPFSFNIEVLATTEITMSLYRECVIPLDGELAGDNLSLENTTIVGRSITGKFQGFSYDFNVFFEFYQLRGIETPEQQQCFSDAVDSLLLTTPTTLTMTPDQIEFARSVIQEEHNAEVFTRNISSVYMDQAGAMVSMSMGEFALAYQKGAILTLNGQYIEAYDDYVDPSSLEVFVNSIADPMQDDLKQFFPLNNTSQLKELIAVLFSHMSTFKAQKDGTGIYIPLFMEHLIYCVDPIALESYTAFPVSGGLPEDGRDPNVLDAVFLPPALGDVDGQALEESAGDGDTTADSLTSEASDNRVVMHGMMLATAMLLIAA